MITKRDGFYTKIPPAGRLAIQKWVRNYHLVVYSPNNKDSLKVKVVDEVNGGFKTVLKNKLILTCSVRELFNDLYKPGTGLVGPDVEFSVIDSAGNRLVSDTVFRTLLPPELRPANQTHKESCCCYLCVLASNYQSARSRFSLPVKKILELETKKYELMDDEECY